MNKHCLILLVLTAGLISGCFGGNRSQMTDPFRSRTDSLNERALASLEQGNSVGALALFEEALRLSATRDDYHGQTRALLNLSRLYRQQGDKDRARNAVKKALKLSPETDLQADVSQEMALVEFDLGNNSKAMEWGLRALEQEEGKLKGRRLNLLARIAIKTGQIADAGRYAEQALSHNRTNGPAEEEANSIRLLGRVKMAQGNLQDAEKQLMQALEMDKRFGRPARIADDLEALAELSLLKNDPPRRQDYLERARKIRENIKPVRQPQAPPEARSH
jgi:Tfp pilus assembly protein PilF